MPTIPNLPGLSGFNVNQVTGLFQAFFLANSVVPTITRVLVIGALILFVRHLARILIDRYLSRYVNTVHNLVLIKQITSFAIVILGLSILLESAGISLMPLVTAFGVSGIALALGLKDTLANVFAGFQILATKNIRLGDAIQLESGETGTVTDISWRNTQIRTREHNTTIIPNNNLANSIITNFTHPIPEIVFEIPFSVSTKNDLDKVAKISLNIWDEIAGKYAQKNVAKKPHFSFTKFNESSIQAVVLFSATNITQKQAITSEFIASLHRAFLAKKIIV